MNASDAPFGHQLFEALKRAGLAAIVTSRLDYAGVQRLKQADRAKTVKLFWGSDYALIQRLKTETPEELAVYLKKVSEEAAQAASAAALMLIVIG